MIWHSLQTIVATEEKCDQLQFLFSVYNIINIIISLFKVFIPLAVERYAVRSFSQVATRLAIRESKALADLYGRLSHSLIRANASSYHPDTFVPRHHDCVFFFFFFFLINFFAVVVVCANTVSG